MNQLYFQKNVPAPLQFLIRPMLLIALGIHGLLLILPMPSEKKAEPPKKEEKVKITQLPSPASSPAKVAPSPISSVAPSPVTREPAPRPSSAPAPATRQQAAPVPAPRTQQQQQFQPRQSSRPQAQEPKAPKTTTQTPTTTPSTPASTTSPLKDAPPPTTPPATLTDPFAAFPRYPNAQPGSGGVLKPAYDVASFNTPDKLDIVAGDFQQKLVPSQGFNPPVQKTEPEFNKSDFRVYEVSPKAGGASRYLHLIVKNGKTVILLLSEVNTLDKLQTAATEERTQEDADFDDALGKVDSEKISLVSFDEKYFSPVESNNFTDRNKFNLRSATAVVPDPILPEKLYPIIEGQLVAAGFKTQQTSTYGSGKVYQVTKGTFTIYLILVPADGNKRTAIITSKEAPAP